MIEVTVLNYLSGAVSVPVYTEVPEHPPDRFVVIEKVGERIRDYVRTTSIAVQSYCLSSLYGAASLDETVREAMNEMAACLPNISRSHMESNYNFTDTRTKRYRYQCVYDITYVKE
ncbi:MAG: hypothetical protein Q4D81_00505 [Eubacteriales bacterium]|nr:hypothetical protein [Eubacteriales bacterium]